MSDEPILEPLPEPAWAPPKPKPRKKRKRRIVAKMPARGPMSRRLPPPPPAPPADVTLTLTIKHTINGQQFGPGPVTVSPSLAATLAESEFRNITEERGLTQKRAAIILPGGRTVPVAPDTFEGDNYATALPASLSIGG